MNLDLNMLREMISSTLTELNEPAATTEPEKRALETAESALDAAKAVADEADEEMDSEEEAAKEADAQEEMKSGLTSESFEITKGRLRQIIAEELISAKKQGIL